MRLFLSLAVFTVFSVCIPEISQGTYVGSFQEGEAAVIFGKASWYAEFSRGIKKTTANMEKFDHDKMTCAIWDVPFNTKLKVTNLTNNKSVVVRVNDRGPNRRFYGRVIDLTKAAFSQIEDLDKGLVDVKIEILNV